MIKLEFEGSYKDFRSFLDGLNERTKEALQVVSFTATGHFSKTENESARVAAQDYVREGNKIGAIKAVRTVTGWGLKQAQDFVEQELSLKYKG